jgi:ribosomal-protein-alanine N-acetyltransferase
VIEDAAEQLALRLSNRAFLKPYDPVQPEDFFTLGGQELQIRAGMQQWIDDRAFAFGVFETETSELVGRVALSNVVRGAWQNATIGYWIDGARGGRGYGTEAVILAVRFAFTAARLHRVQAAVMPRNVRSIRVVEKAGFRFEGIAPRYLKINDAWEDHRIFAITSEDRAS